MAPSIARRTVTYRPFWGRWGGLGITAGGALLLVATALEWLLAGQGTSALVPLITVVFLLSTAALAAAMIPLAFGRRGSDGAVGSSVLGKTSLLVFGATFLVNQVAYLAIAYALPALDAGSGFIGFQLTLVFIQFAALTLGAVTIAHRGVATGAARWALLVLALVSIAIGVLVQNSTDPGTITALLLLSTIAQVVTGVVYLRHRQRIPN